MMSPRKTQVINIWWKFALCCVYLAKNKFVKKEGNHNYDNQLMLWVTCLGKLLVYDF